jgi:hypothetical protein
MIKRVALILALATVINFSLSAQNLNLKYYSSSSDGDYENDYTGVAVALFLNDSELKNIEASIRSKGRDLDKLTRNNTWLCWKALNEWEFVDGEKYAIICAANMYSQDCVMIIATIKENGKSFGWWGKSLSKDDID